MIGSDIICVNDTYSEGQLKFWREHGVKFPVKDKIYTISEFVKHTNGKDGVRLAQIDNPPVPVKHSVLGVAMIVPTFKVERFRTLAGDIVVKEKIDVEETV